MAPRKVTLFAEPYGSEQHVWHAKLINSLLQNYHHPAVELSGKSTMLTMEHEVDVALFLFKINQICKHRINVHEKNQRLSLVPLNIGTA